MKIVKSFITVDQFIDNTTDIVSPVYELSDYAMTYSKIKKQYHYTNDPSYSLYLFNVTETDSLTQEEVDNIVTIVQYLNQFLNQNVTYDKPTLIYQVIEYLNNTIRNDTISTIDYSNIIGTTTVKAADYITFTTSKLQASIWCGYQEFETFYPNYEIDNVLPFDNFATTIQNPALAVNTLQNFDLTQFNLRIQNTIGKKPPTAVKILNIPYTVPSTGFTINCYFGFIIYGAQGNYDYILKLQLLDYLTTLGLNQPDITNFFPDILKINEFFLIPRWDMVAIPSQVGSYGINSQVTKTYTANFDTDKYIAVYSDTTYLKDNTYNVPFDYNNIVLQITNGYYTQESYKDFATYYNDLITVNSLDTDFGRMSSKTQKFITSISAMLSVADSNNQIEFINKMLSQRNYIMSTIIRGGITYLSMFFDKHQYYVLPKFEMNRITSGG